MKARISRARAGLEGSLRTLRQAGSFRAAGALGLLVCIALPFSAAGQQAAPRAAAQVGLGEPAGGERLSAVCAARVESDPFLVEVSRARDLDEPEASRAALQALEPEARRRAEVAERAEHRDHPEARQHLEVLLVGVLELARIGRRVAGADSQVVEDHVVLGPGVPSLAELGAEGLPGIDRHRSVSCAGHRRPPKLGSSSARAQLEKACIIAFISSAMLCGMM